MSVSGFSRQFKMFGTKQKTLPPRPSPPGVDEILEDLRASSNKDDIAFKLIHQEKQNADNAGPLSNAVNLNVIYNTVKTYLDIRESLKACSEGLHEEESQLESSVHKMKNLMEGIKEQAQAALIQ